MDIKLGDIKGEGMDYEKDFIQFLSSSTANTIDYAVYIEEAYLSELGLDTAGWYDPITGESMDGYPLAAGAGFLGYFFSDVKLIFPDPLDIKLLTP